MVSGQIGFGLGLIGYYSNAVCTQLQLNHRTLEFERNSIDLRWP